jgi:hypothetical protein
LNGRKYRRLACPLFLLLLCVSGCAESIAAPPCSNTCFDPAAAGGIEGRVVWSGESPIIEPFPYLLPGGLGGDAKAAHWRNNPFTPIIDPDSHGVSEAVVYLRGIDPHRCRPWDHARVLVEQRGLELHIRQGETDGRVGFVRCGDEVEMVSRDRRLHVLHARGPSWFARTFPEAGQPLFRPLDQSGVIELTSGAGYFWMRGYLLVDEHPYYTRTDAEGRFVLSQVPPGRYELVCWVPNWREIGRDREPESGRVARIQFAQAVAITQMVEVKPRWTAESRFVLSINDFEPSLVGSR